MAREEDADTRRRFLFLNQYFPPDEAATAQILGDLVATVAAAGHECRVVASNRGYADPSARYARREQLGRIRVERVATTGFGRRYRAGRLADYATFLVGAAFRLLSGPRPDVVVTLTTPPILGALGAVGARLRRARSVQWVMDLYPDLAFVFGAMRPGGLMGRLFSFFSRRTLRAADLVVALGETMAKRLLSLGARRVTVVHNWADGNAIRPMGREESRFRRERGWTGKLVVLFSGNMGLAQEFGTALDAAEMMREDPRLVFAFCGVGPRHAEVIAAAAARALPNVEFHPPVRRADLGALLGAGDVHVVTLLPGTPGLLVPSKAYGSLAAGRPIVYIGPPEGEVFDLVSGSGCGACHGTGEAGAVVATLSRWREDEEARESAGRRGRALFEARFTREAQTARFLESLEAVADLADPGRRRGAAAGPPI